MANDQVLSAEGPTGRVAERPKEAPLPPSARSESESNLDRVMSDVAAGRFAKANESPKAAGRPIQPDKEERFAERPEAHSQEAEAEKGSEHQKKKKKKKDKDRGEERSTSNPRSEEKKHAPCEKEKVSASSAVATETPPSVHGSSSSGSPDSKPPRKKRAKQVRDQPSKPKDPELKKSSDKEVATASGGYLPSTDPVSPAKATEKAPAEETRTQNVLQNVLVVPQDRDAAEDKEESTRPYWAPARIPPWEVGRPVRPPSPLPATHRREKPDLSQYELEYDPYGSQWAYELADRPFPKGTRSDGESSHVGSHTSHTESCGWTTQSLPRRLPDKAPRAPKVPRVPRYLQRQYEKLPSDRSDLPPGAPWPLEDKDGLVATHLEGLDPHRYEYYRRPYDSARSVEWPSRESRENDQFHEPPGPYLDLPEGTPLAPLMKNKPGLPTIQEYQAYVRQSVALNARVQYGKRLMERQELAKERMVCNDEDYFQDDPRCNNNDPTEEDREQLSYPQRYRDTQKKLWDQHVSWNAYPEARETNVEAWSREKGPQPRKGPQHQPWGKWITEDSSRRTYYPDQESQMQLGHRTTEGHYLPEVPCYKKAQRAQTHQYLKTSEIHSWAPRWKSRPADSEHDTVASQFAKQRSKEATYLPPSRVPLNRPPKEDSLVGETMKQIRKKDSRAFEEDAKMGPPHGDPYL